MSVFRIIFQLKLKIACHSFKFLHLCKRLSGQGLSRAYRSVRSGFVYYRFGLLVFYL